LTFAVPMLPVPFATLHVRPAGAACTVTAYAVPVVIDDEKAKVFAPEATVTVALPLANTKPSAVAPLTVPPSV
jgi:hypothetical protein